VWGPFFSYYGIQCLGSHVWHLYLLNVIVRTKNHNSIPFDCMNVGFKATTFCLLVPRKYSSLLYRCLWQVCWVDPRLFRTYGSVILVYVHRVTPKEWDALLRTSKEGKLVEPHLSTMPYSKVLGVKLDPLIDRDQWARCTAPRGRACHRGQWM